MPTFTPPTTNDVPPVYPSDEENQDPWRFFADGPRGLNVWKLTDGSYTQAEPQTLANVSVVYHGGHIHPITAGEAALLTAAGYGAYIT